MTLLPDYLLRAKSLHTAWKNGALGGDVMPEDAKPAALLRKGEGALAYFTLPMALNYQRNSYKLWEAATQAWEDKSTSWVFEPCRVVDNDFAVLQTALVRHRVALQPNKHPQTWRTICASLVSKYDGRLELLLASCQFDIARIKTCVQQENKTGFPYLAGAKICNYWLYVLTQYTDYPFSNRAEISIAPDTHVIQASRKLGIISDSEFLQANVQDLVAVRWQDILQNSELEPIDMHTPLWLWSRAGFPAI